MTKVVPIGTDESPGRHVLALNNSDWRLRRAAVLDLVREGDHEAVRSVLNSIRDDHINLNLITSAIQVLAGTGVDTTSALADFLTDPNPEVRSSAALTLGLQNNVRGIPSLMGALRDEDANVRYHVIEALGRLRTAEASATLIEIVETRDFALAFGALDALAKIGDARVAYRLVPILGDDLLQSAVIDALGEVGEEEAIPALAEIVNSDPAAAAGAARSMSLVHDRLETSYRSGSTIAEIARGTITTTGAHNLMAAVEAADTPSLACVVAVLGWLEHPGANELLVGLIGHPELGAAAAEQLVRKGVRAVDILVAHLAQGDLAIRRAAASALGRIGSKDAVPSLLRALMEDADLTVAVAGALAMIGDQRAYAPLLGLLEWDDPAIRRAAVSALNSLGHAEMGRDMAPRLRDERARVRECAARIVGYAGYPELIDLLLQRCQDADESVRRAAVESLPCMNDDPRIQSALALALADPVDAVRSAAVRTLGQFAGAATGELLRNALTDTSAWVRYYAVRSLARQQYLPALDDLLQRAQSDPAMQVRVAAVETLGPFGTRAAGPVLAEIAESSDIHLACAALMALGIGRYDIALPILAAAILSDDPARRLAATRALGALRRAEAVPTLAKAAVSTETELGSAAIHALQRLALPEAVEILVALTEVPTLRDACVTALAHCEPAQVARGLTHLSLDVRLAVVRALGCMRGQNVSDLLFKGLLDAAGAVRYAALKSLIYSDNPPEMAMLALRAETDPEPAIRRMAKFSRRR
jgi:HEAT repeat protein